MDLFVLCVCAGTGIPVLVLLTALSLLLSAGAFCGEVYSGGPAIPMCSPAVPAAGRRAVPGCIRAPPAG